MLDGEIVAFDADGRPSLEPVRERMAQSGETAIRRHAQSAPVTYILFDLLWLDGHSLLDLPYQERRDRLGALALTGVRWQSPAFHRGDGPALLAAAGGLGLNGVVAKRLDSPYTPGGRGWLEITS